MNAQPRHLSDITATRWKNGLGTTRELMRVEASDGDGFALRVSVANVECDAVFSLYPGVDRTLAVLRGNGLHLIDAGTGVTWKTLQTPQESLSFAGERALEGRLIDGPILDFNVMTRRDIARAALRIVGPAQTVWRTASCRLLFVVRGSVRIAHDDGHVSMLRELEFIEPDGAMQIATLAGAAAFLVDQRRAVTA
jgi:uncharacterized protein